MKKFEEQEIILNYTAIIDSSRLGYHSYRIYLKFRNLNEIKKKEMFDFLSSIPETTIVSSIDGQWDVGMVVAVKNIYDFKKIWTRMMKFRQNIENYKISIYSPIHYFTRTLILKDSKEMPNIMRIGGNKEAIYDDFDVLLLKEIARNARKPITEIAEKLKTTAGIVQRRIKNLENNKTILGYRPLFNWNKLGYSYYKVDMKLNNYEKNKQLFSFCHLHPNIIQVNDTIGGSDFEFEVFAESKEKFLSIINEMQNKFSEVIENYEYFIISHPIKETFMSF